MHIAQGNALLTPANPIPLSTLHSHPAHTDYTETPKNNLLPGDVNMVKLRSMYLRRRLRRVEKDGTIVTRTELIRR